MSPSSQLGILRHDTGFTSPNPVMHSIPLASHEMFGLCALIRNTPEPIQRQIQLGVGVDGIVGRAVSIFDGTGVVLGEGVIGWN